MFRAARQRDMDLRPEANTIRRAMGPSLWIFEPQKLSAEVIAAAQKTAPQHEEGRLLASVRTDSTVARASRLRARGKAILTLVALWSVAACDQGPQQAAPPPPAPPPVTVAKPVVKDIIEWDDYTGRFEAVAEVDVRARVAGYLESIHFKDGAFVKQGDLLFVIDRRPYQAASNRSEAAVNAARTRVEWAKAELDRAERLVRSGTTAERTVDDRRQQHDTAQADLNGARAALEEVRLNLGFTEIKAPIAGRISRRLVTEGNLVAANETLLTTIVSLDPIYFYFDVDERSVLAYGRMVREGTMTSPRETPIEVMVALADESQATRKGRLNFVDNRMDAATGTMRARGGREQGPVDNAGAVRPRQRSRQR